MSELASTPVVVLSCFRHGGLAIVRSLGRLGASVYAVHRDRVSPAFFSRYCHERIIWDIDTAAPEASVRFLNELSARIGRRAILIATSDLGALFVADNADRLAEWFDFPAQDSAMMHALCSKREMYHLAKKWNVPTPETAFPQSRTDIETFLETARFPVLLKPISSGPSALPMRRVEGRDELLRCFDSIEDLSSANVMIQEYIPGGDEMTWTFNGYFDRRGECDVAFTGRKLRNYPAYFGQASLGLCTHNERVRTTTIAFMKAIGYRGPLDVGFRYDARDGRYKVNDINPRIGAMFRCFVGANGMDTARALYQDMSGLKVSPAATQESRKWIVEDRDWLSALRYCRDGNLTLRGWLQSLRGVKEMSFLSWDDPKPVLGVFVMVVHAARKAFKRILPRIRVGGIRGIGQERTVL